MIETRDLRDHVCSGSAGSSRETRVLFSCFPNSDCEWYDLRRFVVDYNEDHDTTYRRFSCHDRVIRDRPAVDVLLKAENSLKMAIERKSVVWPPDFLSNHRNMHDLADMVEDRIKHIPRLLHDDLYQLRVHSDVLHGRKKKQIEELAEAIGQAIVGSRRDEAGRIEVRGDQPALWRFGPASQYDRDETTPESGFGIHMVGPLFPRPGYNYAKERTLALEGMSSELLKQVDAAAKKLRLYVDYEKMLMLQFFADLDVPLADDDIIELVKATDVPYGIDEVWVAYQDFYSPYDYEVAWQRLV